MKKNNQIHSSAIVHESAVIGENNYIGPYCLIGPNVTIGSGNRFEAYVSIGTPGEHRDYFRSEPGKVIVGDNNIVREFVTINGGTTSTTTLGSDIVMLRGSHVGHDAEICSKTTMSCNVLIGGHSVISMGANLGLGAVVHQHRVIGAFSMVGMNSAVTKNIPPFVIAFGSPCNPQKINRVGLLRNGVKEEDLISFEKWYFKLQGLYDNLVPLDHEYTNHINEYEKKKDYLLEILRHS